MEILYDDSKVKKYFCDYNRINKKCGIEITKQIKKRVDQIESCENVFDILSLPGKPHHLTGNFQGCIALTIDKIRRLILDTKLQPNDLATIEKMLLCKEIYIKGVVEYHGEKDEWIIP